MQQPRTTRLEDIGTNSRCSQCGYTRVDLPYKNEQNMRYTIEEIRQMPEGQTFDCKSIHIEPKALANTIVAMANADGGMIAVGISDKTRRIEGVNQDKTHLNEILRTPFDFCVPTISVTTESCLAKTARAMTTTY